MSDDEEIYIPFNEQEQEQKEEENPPQEKLDFSESLNKYYKLKKEYEDDFKKSKNAIIKTEGWSWKEKRRQFVKLKPKCVNCKRPVGSLFYVEVDKHERIAIAKCGDKTNPCPLNIVINLGMVLDLENEMINDEKTIATTKKNIIIDKNDLLFGYINSQQAVQKFDRIKDDFTSTSTNYEYLLTLYEEIVNNKQKKERLAKEDVDFQLLKSDFKKLISEFEKTQNVQFVNDAVTMYVNEMSPLLSKIMKNKYVYSGVDYNDNNNTFNLIQIPIFMSIPDLEYDLSSTHEQGVVSFVVGTDIVEKKRKTTSTTSDTVNSQLRPLQAEEEGEKEKEEENEERSISSSSSSSSSSSESESDEESESDDNKSESSEESVELPKPLTKIIIHPQLLPDGSISITEANRLKFPITTVNRDTVIIDPATNKEKTIMKRDLVATHPQTNVQYNVTM